MQICGNKIVWLTGDSWLDWRSLIKSDVVFESSVEGLFCNYGYRVLSFARGGNSNLKQVGLVSAYTKLSEQRPDIWIHAWTEVGRDLKNQKIDNSSVEQMSLETAYTMLELEKSIGSKLYVFGGQSKIPDNLHSIFGNRMVHPDIKAFFLGTEDYGSSQFFSLFFENEKIYLPKKMFRDEFENSNKQFKILSQSGSFPDNAHLGPEQNICLYKLIKEKINDS